MARGLRDWEVVGEQLRLVLRNTIEAVEDGRIPLMAFARSRCVGPAALNRLDVIFEELVSNAIRHGFRPGSGQSLHVRARASAERVDLVIEDDGEPFNPLEQPQPAGPARLEDATVGGLGISLVVRLAASVRYERPTPSDDSAFRPTNRLFVTIAGP